MERNEIVSKVTDILVEKLAVEPEEVTMETNIEKDLYADSIDFVEIITESEMAFRIEIKDNDAISVKTVNDLVDVIEKEVNKEERS